MVMDMKPKQRAKAIAEQLEKSDRRERLSRRLSETPKTLSSPASQKSSKAKPIH